MSTLFPHLWCLLIVLRFRHSCRSVAPSPLDLTLLCLSLTPLASDYHPHLCPHHPWHRVRKVRSKLLKIHTSAHNQYSHLYPHFCRFRVAPRASPSATRLLKKTISKRLEAKVAGEAGMVAAAGPAEAILPWPLLLE